MTGEQMCQLIAEYWKKEYGIDVLPEDIWNYSPTGELSAVFAWYEEAIAAQQQEATNADA